MPDFHMTDDDRRDALQEFPAGARWSAVRSDPEAMRFWDPMREEPGLVLLRHGTNAVLELRLDRDVITAARVLEGADAERLVRAHAFRPSDAQRAAVDRVFQRGRALDEVLRDARDARLAVTEVRAAPAGRRRFDVGRRGVVEVEVGVDGRIGAPRWLTGGDALDALVEGVEEKRWDVPPAVPDQPVRARTASEARLFVAAMRGTLVEAERQRDRLLEILAYTPEGLRRFAFEVERPGAPDGDYGSGTSPCLDPATLVLFAQRVEEDLPSPDRAVPANRPRHARNLKLAADGLREAARFVAPGEDLPPLGIYTTRAGEFLRMKHPDRFRRDRLLAEAERLDRLAREWGA